MSDTHTIKSFLNGKIWYDRDGQYIWNETKRKGLVMIADIRGWGAIQNLFKRPDGTIDFDSAGQFQDRLGQFIADAIREKLERVEP